MVFRPFNKELAELDGLERIRYTTSHPKDMDDDLISAHGEVPKLMPYLHLPVQSGSNTMLKHMNRKHDVTFYRLIIDKLRKHEKIWLFFGLYRWLPRRN